MRSKGCIKSSIRFFSCKNASAGKAEVFTPFLTKQAEELSPRPCLSIGVARIAKVILLSAEGSAFPESARVTGCYKEGALKNEWTKANNGLLPSTHCLEKNGKHNRAKNQNKHAHKACFCFSIHNFSFNLAKKGVVFVLWCPENCTLGNMRGIAKEKGALRATLRHTRASKGICADYGKRA